VFHHSYEGGLRVNTILSQRYRDTQKRTSPPPQRLYRKANQHPSSKTHTEDNENAKIRTKKIMNSFKSAYYESRRKLGDLRIFDQQGTFHCRRKVPG
jgi:DNA modification methylase